MPWLSVNQTRLAFDSAVPTPDLALDVQRAGTPGAPGAMPSCPVMPTATPPRQDDPKFVGPSAYQTPGASLCHPISAIHGRNAWPERRFVPPAKNRRNLGSGGCETRHVGQGTARRRTSRLTGQKHVQDDMARRKDRRREGGFESGIVLRPKPVPVPRPVPASATVMRLGRAREWANRKASESRELSRMMENGSDRHC